MGRAYATRKSCCLSRELEGEVKVWKVQFSTRVLKREQLVCDLVCGPCVLHVWWMSQPCMNVENLGCCSSHSTNPSRWLCGCTFEFSVRRLHGISTS